VTDSPPPAEAAATRDTSAAATEPARAVVRATTPAPTAAAPTSAPLASVIARPTPSTGGRGTSILLALAAAIAVGGIAFAAGRLTAPAATATTGRGAAGQLPGAGQGLPGRGDGFGGISLKGDVTAVSATSISLKLASGSVVTIPLGDDTAYHTATSASAADVVVGSQVAVTPGGRAGGPSASLEPGASLGPAAGIAFGPATDVTVIEP
jgi:hypothetical protein